MNRSAMPAPGQYTDNVQMADTIDRKPIFKSIANEVQHEREVQAMRYFYAYSVSGSVQGQTTAPFNITIEQGSDFSCKMLTASAFSYDDANVSDFPIPNSLGATAWAGRGLSVKVTDTRAGRELTSGFVPFELLGTPGYGLNFQNPFPLRYFFYRNSKIRFDVRNRDNTDRTHDFEICVSGFKILTPQ